VRAYAERERARHTHQATHPPPTSTDSTKPGVATTTWPWLPREYL